MIVAEFDCTFVASPVVMASGPVLPGIGVGVAVLGVRVGVGVAVPGARVGVGVVSVLGISIKATALISELAPVAPVYPHHTSVPPKIFFTLLIV